MPSYKEQFNLSIFDYSPVGYCVLELVLDDKGQPVDWIYRYCKIDDQVVHRYDAQMLNESTDEEEIKVKCPYCGRKMCEGQIHSFNSGMEWRSVLGDVSIARRSSYLMNERKTDMEMGGTT